MSLLRLSRRHWLPAVLLASVVGGGVAVLVWDMSGGETAAGSQLFVGAIASFTIVACGLLLSAHWRLAELSSRNWEATLECRNAAALSNIRPLLGQLPVPINEWTIEPILAATIINLMVSRPPKLVVECGSGSSSVYIAACLRELGSGKLISLEHDSEFGTHTSHLLERHGLTDWAEVIDAPLSEHECDGVRVPWYTFGSLDRFLLPIDLLVVDGPPGDLWHEARYPAVPLLMEALSPSAVVLLDDGAREDERLIAERWSQALNGVPEYITCLHGAWLIRRNTRRA